MEKLEVKNKIMDLIKKYFSLQGKERFIPGKTRIPLNIPSYNYEEVCEAVESILSTNVTMGKKVEEFEAAFAAYIGVRHAIMVNSGSSANLVTLSILTNPLTKNRIQPGDEIITPAATWSTTVFPIINLGLVPVLVDVDLKTFNLKPEEVERAITSKTKAIMLVHVLGNPCDMRRITEIAKAHNLLIIEDACEAHGAELNGQKVGSFGDLSTFSFYFSHHISTVEGGMVLTNNTEYAELARALRVFGWVREYKDRAEIAERYNFIDPRFLFFTIGYNFRPTELQGAFGMHQVKKLDKFVEIRRENARFWMHNLEKYSDNLWVHEERQGTKHVWLGYPVTVNPKAPFSRKDLVDFLEKKGVETRPIMAGNIAEQPAMTFFLYRKVGDLPNSKLIMRHSFFFANHAGIGEEERKAVLSYIEEFMTGRC